MIEMMRLLRPASELDVAELENANALALPESYRRFLREHNGGRPIDGEFPVPGWGVTVVDFFFGIGVGENYDLQKQLDRLEDPLNSELIPIACDPGGWHVYLGVRGSCTGRVYFWDHKTSGSRPMLIGDDFDSFVASLKPDGTYDDYEFGKPA